MARSSCSFHRSSPFDEALAHEFFTTLRELHPQHLHTGFIALEPRHASWFTPPVDRLLRSFEIARVAADPPKGSTLAATPGGWHGLCYWRLHGAPRTYYSAYDSAFLRRFATQLLNSACPHHWVIFDNTALGHATANALELSSTLLRSLTSLAGSSAFTIIHAPSEINTPRIIVVALKFHPKTTYVITTPTM